ncbi:MAG: hypothetical protein Q8P67_29265, partial [archaeon]|nr:hypothetical protein [archaeon]
WVHKGHSGVLQTLSFDCLGVVGMEEVPMGLLKSIVQNGFISGLNIQQNRIKEQSKFAVVGKFLLYLLEKTDQMRIIQNPGCVELKRKNWRATVI